MNIDDHPQIAQQLGIQSIPAVIAFEKGKPVDGFVGALPEADLALAQALADVATIGILQERAVRRGEVVNEQLQTALNSRVVIEQAKGVTAQRLGVGMDVAFDRLRRHARSNNLRLADLARRVVAGELDPSLLPAPSLSTTDRS